MGAAAPIVLSADVSPRVCTSCAADAVAAVTVAPVAPAAGPPWSDALGFPSPLEWVIGYFLGDCSEDY